MPETQKEENAPDDIDINPTKKSRFARMIDWANVNVPGNPASNLARFIAKSSYEREKSKQSRNKDACAQHKKILKVPTGDWYDDPGSADVLGIDMPTTNVKQHTRITPKTRQLKLIKKYQRSSKKFPESCKKISRE